MIHFSTGHRFGVPTNVMLTEYQTAIRPRKDDPNLTVLVKNHKTYSTYSTASPALGIAYFEV